MSVRLCYVMNNVMTRYLCLIFAGILCLAGCSSDRLDSPSVIPMPVEMTVGEGTFCLAPSVPVTCSLDDQLVLKNALNAYHYEFARLFGKDCCIFGPKGPRVRFSVNSALGEEEYILKVNADGVSVEAGGGAGAFYGVQTLLQLVPAEDLESSPLESVDLPYVEIHDYPEISYRGVMLDVARHFFTVDEVKTVLDIMALHKMNVFHWHLTDDQGWRIQIDKYPNLTEFGSIRKRTIIGKDPGGEYDETTQYDETPHGGFYTKDEIRDIVAYAASKHITVIPEIEFPGHARAAIASYPYLGCTGEQYEVRQTWDIEDIVFCIGKETTFRFFEDVLSEVVELFPSQLIHIGGDECPRKMWKDCPHCNERMKQEGLTEYGQLQSYGVARLEDFLAEKGRSIIGWDEILDAGVRQSAVVMSWRGTDSGIKAAKLGNRVIMSPTEFSYFDYYQSEDIENEPLAWGGYLPLEKVYSFNPYVGLDENQKELVIGVQANLWTEYISDIEHVTYMLLPRLAAMAETGWNPRHNDFEDFLGRLEKFICLYAQRGYNFAQFARFEE